MLYDLTRVNESVNESWWWNRPQSIIRVFSLLLDADAKEIEHRRDFKQYKIPVHRKFYSKPSHTQQDNDGLRGSLLGSGEQTRRETWRLRERKRERERLSFNERNYNRPRGKAAEENQAVRLSFSLPFTSLCLTKVPRSTELLWCTSSDNCLKEKQRQRKKTTKTRREIRNLFASE